MRVYGGNEVLGQKMRLLQQNGQHVPGQIVDVEPTPFDHVVRSVADLPAPAGGYIDLTDGSWAFAAPINVGTDTVRVPTGTTVYLHGFGWSNTLSGNGTYVVEVQGIALIDRLSVIGLGTHAVGLTHASAIASLCGCDLSALGYAVEVTLGDRLQVIGGLWAAYAALHIDGAIRLIQVCALQDRSTDYFVYYSSGAVESCIFTACTAEHDIRWPAADIPSDGLLIVATAIAAATPWNGFTAASARVNVKACTNSAGLEAETAIV
jgi:hypothetical protein